MRPRKLNRIIAASASIIAFTATGLGSCARPAFADGILNASETAYVNTYGQWVVCTPISNYPAPATVVQVVQAVMGDGFTADNAVDVVNGAVLAHCSQHWDLLTLVGAMARGEA